MIFATRETGKADNMGIVGGGRCSNVGKLLVSVQCSLVAYMCAPAVNESFSVTKNKARVFANECVYSACLCINVDMCLCVRARTYVQRLY